MAVHSFRGVFSLGIKHLSNIAQQQPSTLTWNFACKRGLPVEPTALEWKDHQNCLLNPNVKWSSKLVFALARGPPFSRLDLSTESALEPIWHQGPEERWAKNQIPDDFTDDSLFHHNILFEEGHYLLCGLEIITYPAAYDKNLVISIPHW